MKHKTLIILPILLSSCALPPTQSEVERLSAQARVRDSSPICTPENCQRKWDAAQVWVSQNSAFKIQTASSAIIETYSPSNGDTRLAMQVFKNPVKDGNYEITIRAYCNNWISCSPDPLFAAQKFNDYINAIK